MIKLYIYRISDGSFLYEDFGRIPLVVEDIISDYDFTTQPVPIGGMWYWHNNAWQTEPKLTP